MPKDQKILEAIAKTGFVLEHDVVTSLQNEGWKTMSGSYYIDDVSNQKRHATDGITCFTRYIVKKMDTSASVHFVKSSAIDGWIHNLNPLHIHNRDFLKKK